MDPTRVVNMVALLESSDHPDKERSRELNELRKLALYELLKEKEARVRNKQVAYRPGCSRPVREITINDDTEELKYLLKTFGEST